MSLPSITLLVGALNRPVTLTELSPSQWDLLIRQGRQADVLGRIAAHCVACDVMASIPPQPRRHLESASNLVVRQHRELRWELRHIEDAMARSGIAVVLLKGAAYAMGGFAAARGRMMSDVDILVPQAALPEVESALMLRGWVSAAKTAYDQRYYRTWMHELPPMRHFSRGTVIDVHHAIVPLSSRSHPSTEALLARATPVQEGSRIQCLAPLDMLLHSASHLFHEGELEQGFRGVVDIDSLLREFGELAGFWQGLVNRAIELELVRPLFYALRYTSLMLETPVPAEVMNQARRAPGAPAFGFFLDFMDALFLRALRPAHASTADRWTPLARGMLYLRGHWLRMPPGLLILHLLRKLAISTQSKEES